MIPPDGKLLGHGQMDARYLLEHRIPEYIQGKKAVFIHQLNEGAVQTIRNAVAEQPCAQGSAAAVCQQPCIERGPRSGDTRYREPCTGPPS